MPGIPLPWQIVIIVSVIAGIAILLTVLGHSGTSGSTPGRGRRH